LLRRRTERLTAADLAVVVPFALGSRARNDPVMTTGRVGERIHGLLAAWAILFERESAKPPSDASGASKRPEQQSDLLQRLREHLLLSRHVPDTSRQPSTGETAAGASLLAQRLRRVTLCQFLTDPAEIELLESALDSIDAMVRQFPVASGIEHEPLPVAPKPSQTAPRPAEGWPARMSEHPLMVLRRLLDPIPVGIWAYDASGLLVGLNPEAEWMHVKPASSLVGHYNVIDDIRANPAICDLAGKPLAYDDNPIVRALRGETVRQAELVWRAEGRDYYLQLDGAALRDTQGNVVGIVVAARDIGPRVAFERELEQERSAAEAASRHKTLMLAALAHDIRAPLNTVSLATELLEGHVLDQSHPDVVENLRAVRHSIGNVLELLSEILDLSRIEAGAMPLTRTRFAIRPALEECLASILTQARRKGLTCELDDRKASQLTIETDRVKFKQIVSNLLTNALRHTEKGQIPLEVEADRDEIFIRVIDTGPGIAPEDQSRVFEAFTRLESPYAGPHDGIGLGLSIARRLAELLGAKLELESTLGQGSRFTFRLPRAPHESAPSAGTNH
jgi:signal transduction histidine kinase